MEITVKMSPSEYDAYRAYQREKDSLEREVGKDYAHLRERHEKICAAILSALELDESTLYAGDVVAETSIIATVKDHASAEKAVDLASDWFC